MKILLDKDQYSPIIALSNRLPNDTNWLDAQTRPVIAVSDVSFANADVVVTTEKEAHKIAANISKYPGTALILAQVLRATECVSVETGIMMESLAYSTLQSGLEHQNWLTKRKKHCPFTYCCEANEEAIILRRKGSQLFATLNRPARRNAISVEMRDAFQEMCDLVLYDETIHTLNINAAGACFSVGGDLQEFGLLSNPAEGHLIRSLRHPGRAMAGIANKTRFFLHSACIGSGIEIAAFAEHVVARRNSFFQLPELSLGLIPGAGGCISVARRIGRQRTAWMVYSGRKITATKALEWGLVDELN